MRATELSRSCGPEEDVLMRQSCHTDHVLCHINCSIVCFDLQVNDKLFGIHEKNVHVPYKSGTIFRVPDQECLRWMKSMPMESLAR